MWPTVSCSSHHVFPVMVDYILKLQTKVNSPSLHCFCWVLDPEKRKVTDKLPIHSLIDLTHWVRPDTIWDGLEYSNNLQRTSLFQIYTWICKDRQWTMIKYIWIVYTAWYKENKESPANERAFWEKADLRVRLGEQDQPYKMRLTKAVSWLKDWSMGWEQQEQI